MALNDDPNKKQDSAYAAGANVRRIISAPYASMGQGYMAQSQAASQAAAPARGFTRGLVGAAPQAPAPAPKPQIKFAGTDAAPDAMFRRPTGVMRVAGRAQAPSQRMTLDQAHAAEVNARTATQSPTGPQSGVGAPARAGGAAPSMSDSYFIGSNGVRRGITATGAVAGTAPSSVPVNRQAFTAPARPRVASTYGLSVNDPRVDDQVTPRAQPNRTLRGPDAMAEQYNAREDREARAKLASDLDSQRFRLEMIAGNPGRRGRAALEALGQNARQQAALAAGGERLSAEAVQNRAQRANVLANTGLEQGGADRRAELEDATRREGQQLGYRADMARTGADLTRPQLLQDSDGNYVSVSAGRGQPVTRPDGAPVRGLVQQAQTDFGDDNKLWADLYTTQVDAQGQLLPDAAERATAAYQHVLAAQGRGGQQRRAVPDASNRVKGQVYDTPRGKMKWTGTGWVAAQ